MRSQRTVIFSVNALLERAENVVFDIGNVLLSFEPEKTLPRIIGEEAARRITARDIVGSPMWPRLDEGTVTEEETARYAARLAGDEALWPLALRFIQHFHEEMEPLPAWELIPKFHATGKKVFALSNYGEHTFARTQARFADLFGQMDGMVISGREKVLKPELRIYRLLLDRYHLRPETCVFIDDYAPNVEGARRAGMQAILYTGFDSLL